MFVLDPYNGNLSGDELPPGSCGFRNDVFMYLYINARTRIQFSYMDVEMRELGYKWKWGHFKLGTQKVLGLEMKFDRLKGHTPNAKGREISIKFKCGGSSSKGRSNTDKTYFLISIYIGVTRSKS